MNRSQTLKENVFIQLCIDYNTQTADEVMKLINSHWKEIYDQGGLPSRLEIEFELEGLDFDDVNLTVQSIIA